MQYSSESARSQMVRQQVRCWAVLDPRVLEVQNSLPREDFVPAAYRSVAYADTAIPLACGQSMMTPTIEGRLLQALEISPHDKILEIGTGSGYLTACLARLGSQVTSVEIFPQLADAARGRLADQGIVNAECVIGDAFALSPGAYDVIAVTGAVPGYRGEFDSFLKPGGRLFVVDGSKPVMKAWLMRRDGSGELQREQLFETFLPPLLHAAVPPRFVF